MQYTSSGRSILAGLLLATLVSSASLDAATRAESSGGVIVSGSRESTEAGMAILRAGGTAADAAVAVSMALGVSEPFNSGLGGKFVALYYDAKTQKVRCIEALDEAPGALDLARVARLSMQDREKGYVSACVPGMAAGVELMHKTWGKLPWKDCMQPAVDLAKCGYAVPAKQLTAFREKLDILLQNEEASRIYLQDGKVPKAGTIIKNPDLARTLARLAEKGAEEFYKGETARLLVDASQAGGGWFSEEDFAGYRAHWLSPLSVDYAGKEIFTSPSPLTGGAIVLLAMKTMEQNKNGAKSEPMSLTRVDTVSRVFQQIYPVVSGLFANTPDSERNSGSILRQTTYANIWKRAQGADPRTPFENSDARNSVSEDANGSTTHFIVVDHEGNIACVTQSLAHHFGAGVVAPGTGILLNNCMANFSYSSPRAINYVQPGKRPRSTMAPTIVLENHKPYLALGSPASQRIPTGIYQVLSGVLDYHQNLSDAIDQPRFHPRSRRSSSEAPNVIDLEDGFLPETGAELTEHHWDIQSKGRGSYYFGGVNAVQFLPNGHREAVADDRRTNWPEGE